ncbi:MAG: TonB-dependent receptor [Gemmatimonadetes bacterium]|nr:TonB-dependent receptor [Gemmatimonadota bacterium]
MGRAGEEPRLQGGRVVAPVRGSSPRVRVAGDAARLQSRQSPRGELEHLAQAGPRAQRDRGALYLGEEREFGERWALRYGARLSGFVRTGTATIFQYATNAPVVYDSLLGTLQARRGGRQHATARATKVKAYGAIEPRASVRFSLSEGTSVKASYARTVQYLHLASKTNSPTPLDVWEPAGPYLRPQRADQVAFGVQRITPGQAWDLSAEAFVKRSHDVVDFVDGADVILNEKLETLMLQGEGVPTASNSSPAGRWDARRDG